MAPGKKTTAAAIQKAECGTQQPPESSAPIAMAQTRRSVRTSTMNRRPGVEAGLAPRLQSDISAAAQNKRDKKTAKDKAKQDVKNQRVAREAAGAKEVAAMLDRHAQKDKESVAELELLPPSDEEPEMGIQHALTQPGGAAASDRNHPERGNKVHTPTNHTQASFHLRDNDSDNDLYLDSPLPQLGLDSALDNVHSPMSLDTPQDLDEPEGPQTVDRVGGAEGREKSRQGQIARASISQGKHVNTTGAAMSNEPLTKPAKLTESQKKKARVSQVRGQVNSARQNMSLVVAPAPTKRPSEPSPGVKKTKKRKEEDTFAVDYRARMRAAATTPVRVPCRPPSSPSEDEDCGLVFLDSTGGSKAVPAPASKPLTASTSHPLWKYAPFTFESSEEASGSPGPSTVPLVIYQHDRGALSDEEIGGFGDDDIAVSREAVITRKNVLPNTMVAILPQAAIEGDAVVPASTKKTRAVRTQVSTAISRALFALDNWVQDSVLTKIVPSLIAFYGAQENPWDLDGVSRTEFKKTLNGLLTRIYPNRAPHEVTAGDKLWRFTRQQVYDWRSQIGRLAIKVAKAEVQRRADEHGKHFAATWVANALAKGGEATYSMPDIRNPGAARGALQTSYHIRLLTYHYEQADGAIIATSYPIGALSLAVVAIRRALRACITGVYVPIKTEFSGEEVGQQTEQARKGAVAGLEKTPHRFDALIAAARSQVPSFLQAQALQVQGADDDADAFAAIDPPSSPVS